jgi:hypothetical protein
MRRKDIASLENTYYAAIYDVISRDGPHETKMVALNNFRTKITRLNRRTNLRVFIDNDESDVLTGEEPSIFHIIRAR